MNRHVARATPDGALVYIDQMEGGARATGSGTRAAGVGVAVTGGGGVSVSGYGEEGFGLDAAAKDDLLTMGFGLALGGALWRSTGALIGGLVAFAWGRWQRR